MTTNQLKLGQAAVNIWQSKDINAWLRDNPRDCQCGTPLGMRSDNPDPDAPYKFRLQRLRFVDGCYSLDGTYWGLPANVWRAFASPGEDNDACVLFVRAWDRTQAKQAVLDQAPGAKFWR